MKEVLKCYLTFSPRRKLSKKNKTKTTCVRDDWGLNWNVFAPTNYMLEQLILFSLAVLVEAKVW